MRRVLLQEGEDLVAQFRPHPGSYLWTYSVGALWLAWGALGYYVGAALLTWPPLGGLVLAAAALLHALLVRATRQRGFVLSLVWAALAATLGLLTLAPVPVLPDYPSLVPASVATLAALSVWGVAEFDRRMRRHVLTTRRLQVAGGLSTHHQHTIDLSKVETLRAAQSLLGQLLGYGRITFVFSTKIKGKKGELLEHNETLSGIPRFETSLHQVETVVAELRLPERERKKRVEERRLKESMKHLAGWVRRQPA